MPYIIKDRRDRLSALPGYHPEDAGELTYILTTICKNYLDARETKYHHFNTVIGALECCKLELYRRKIVPYENKKILENGDVYDQGVSNRESSESPSPDSWK